MDTLCCTVVNMLNESTLNTEINDIMVMEMTVT